MIIFVASEDLIEELEPDENLADSFPCMSTQPFDRDARAQLYSLVTHQFLDDAWSLEVLIHSLTEEGPWIYALEAGLVTRLAELDEDDIEELAAQWIDCEEVESLDLEAVDLHEFMYHLVDFCRAAEAGDDLGVFVYGDD